MKTRVEILCVGTELLSGKVNTHISYFSLVLKSIGLNIAREVTLPDDPVEIQQAVRSSMERSDILILSGGLGPTFDDLTREGVAGAVNRKLKLRAHLLKKIKDKFSRYQLPVSVNNKRQAAIIQGAKSLENLSGSAPGQLLVLERRNRLPLSLILLPGPFKELQPMLEKEVIPFLQKTYCRFLCRKTLVLHLAGIMESQVDDKLRPLLTRLSPGLECTILAGPACVDLYVTATSRHPSWGQGALDKIRRTLHGLFGNFIYGEGGDTLSSVVGDLLRRRRQTLAVAESCTGGLLSSRITSIPGSSEYFIGSIVAYSNSLKQKGLGVFKSTLNVYGAVSKECAREMADGVRKKMGATFGLAVTGVAGPSGGTPQKPVGLVYIALSGPRIEHLEKFVFPGDRANIQNRSTVYALNMLRLALALQKS
ncbi:MAG: competence/damage-inducible protein A [Elusimicrobia bacterium]|nr:competence/damage-inducible protein A [Elusimicrobiota bacterium]